MQVSGRFTRKETESRYPSRQNDGQRENKAAMLFFIIHPTRQADFTRFSTTSVRYKLIIR